MGMSRGEYPSGGRGSSPEHTPLPRHGTCRGGGVGVCRHLQTWDLDTLPTPPYYPTPPKRVWLTSGQYASYWNDFLFNNILTSNGFINHFVSVMKLWNAFTNFTTIIPCIKIENFNDFLLYFNRGQIKAVRKESSNISWRCLEQRTEF